MQGRAADIRDLGKMTLIKTADLIESVADALQFISYYHPMDYIRALGQAYEAEANPAAKDRNIPSGSSSLTPISIFSAR